MYRNSAVPRISALLAGLLLGLLAVTTSAASTTSPELTPYEASYTASMSKGVSLNGQGVRTLTDQGNNVWLYRTDVDSFIANIDESLVFKWQDRKSTRLNSSHVRISYAVFCLKKKNHNNKREYSIN